MGKHIVAPSILAADFGNLARDIEMINNSAAQWLHLDVMDGRFVPNISFGQAIVKRMAELCNKVIDVHLMIVEPEKYIEEFRDAGAEVITVHLEACPHLHRTIQQIKASGARAGVAINPHTSVELLEPIIEDIDLVCVMSVNPGYGGQKFIYGAIPKIKRLKEIIDIHNSKAIIEVDGGVGLQNAEKILQAGARVLVAGSSIFKADNPTETIDRMLEIGIESFQI